MLVREILAGKPGGVIVIGPDAGVTEAMRLLVQHNIGSVVVVQNGGIRGILTERDILRAGASDPDGFAERKVQDLMTREVITACGSTGIDQVMDIMTDRRIRHLPITSGADLIGMVSIGDVVNALRRATEAENRYLYAYIAGTPL